MKSRILVTLFASAFLMLFQPSDALKAQKKVMMKAPEYHVLTKSNYDFNDTVELLKASIEKQNLMVIIEVDPQKMLRLVGVQAKGMRQIFFFHPRYMKRIFETNKLASIEPPLKFVVMEKPNGKVIVRYIKPSYMFNSYTGLNDLSKEFEGLMATIVKSITN